MPATKYREPKNITDTYYNKIYAERKMYTNTSTAHEIPESYPRRRREVIESEAAARKRREAARRVQQYARLRGAVAIVVFIALCFTLVYRQTVIFESNQKLKELEASYTELLSLNQSMQSKIDMSLEMGDVEKYAREELGMMKPESGQIFYVDMQMQDSGARGSAEGTEMTALSGIQGTLVNAFRALN